MLTDSDNFLTTTTLIFCAWNSKQKCLVSLNERNRVGEGLRPFLRLSIDPALACEGMRGCVV